MTVYKICVIIYVMYLTNMCFQIFAFQRFPVNHFKINFSFILFLFNLYFYICMKCLVKFLNFVANIYSTEQGKYIK